jgi:pimeloyl-ACP methyl ester carboxylesterase
LSSGYQIQSSKLRQEIFLFSRLAALNALVTPQMKLKLFPTIITIGAILATVVFLFGVVWTIVGLVMIFVTIAAIIIAAQERLLYIPVVAGYKRCSDNPEGYRSPSDWGVSYREFFVNTQDGEKIHGWSIQQAPKKATIIFCHENAGNLGFRVNNLVAIANKLCVNVIAFDYRGYGDSTGEPSEIGLIADTEAVYKYVTGELGLKEIFLYGRSLGGAVAIQYAALLGQRNDPYIRGLIVENTFTSIADMIDEIFPFLNWSIIKKFFLRLKWESHKWIQFVACPILLIVGMKDELVPPSHSLSLKTFCEKNEIVSELLTIEDGHHNDTWAVGGQRYWDTQAKFIARNIQSSMN